MMRGLVVVLGLVLPRAAAAQAAPDLAPLVAAVPACESERATCFEIRIHVPVEAGAPIATATWLGAQLAEANVHFAPLGVGFQVAGISALPASVARVEDRAERSSLGKVLDRTAIDVFITGHLDDVDTAGAMAYGVTWRQGARKFVIVSTQALPRTLAHELGHVFGLPHSEYPISIMNKTERKEPPPEQRTFHADELARMKRRIRQLVRGRGFANVAPRRP